MRYEIVGNADSRVTGNGLAGKTKWSLPQYRAHSVGRCDTWGLEICKGKDFHASGKFRNLESCAMYTRREKKFRRSRTGKEGP